MHNILAAFITLAIAVFSIILMRYKPKEILLIFALALCGLLNDALSHGLKVYGFTTTKDFFDIQNSWLLSLWILFMTTFGGSMAFLKKFPTSALMILGMFGGAISYYFAYKLNAIYFADISWNLLYIAMNWLILFPILFKIYYK
jgi:hypothetical protein